MKATDRMAWNRRSSRYEPVLPRSSEKEKQGYSTATKPSFQVPARALVKVARIVLIVVGVVLLILVLIRRSTEGSEATQPTRAVSYFKSQWSSSSRKTPTSDSPAGWAIKVAEAILPDARTSTAQWEQERLIDLAKIIECRANNNCTNKQKHVVISGVGRWKWSLDETFERPAFFPNGEAGELEADLPVASRCKLLTFQLSLPVLGKSWISTIKEMGYPFIHIADYWGGDDSVRTISRLYRAIGDNVAAVLLDYVAE